MVRECRPPAREPRRSWLARRSTMATSTHTHASEPSARAPTPRVPPSVRQHTHFATPISVGSGFGRHYAARPGACGKPPGALYTGSGKEWVLFFPLTVRCGRTTPSRGGDAGSFWIAKELVTRNSHSFDTTGNVIRCNAQQTGEEKR